MVLAAFVALPIFLMCVAPLAAVAMIVLLPLLLGAFFLIVTAPAWMAAWLLLTLATSAITYVRWRRLSARQRQRLKLVEALREPDRFTIDCLVAAVEDEEAAPEMGSLSLSQASARGRVSVAEDD